MDKTSFNDALSALMEIAISQGNIINKKQISDAFADIIDDDSHYNAIYAYLKERNITINDGMTVVSNATVNTTANTGSEETASSIKIEDTSLEARFADMYSKEVAKISPGKIKIDSLVNKYLEGDDSIRNILVEQHLKLVITISDQFDGHGVRKADLIQEGNLGLIEAVDSYKKEFQNTFSHKDSDEPAPFNQYIISAISKSMQNLVDMETGNSHIGEHLVERVNALSRATEDLAEKHGRPATLKELCEYLSLSEDEVLTVMKISLDALTLNEEDGQQ